ncbi:hypothetical protein [uncultured Brevundimonas sp.]|uniref:hypothetical protein n=1 Tax=uncultured Brevundimonas sp. TaxID=213418 RepID=UPI00262C192A|nr:hypothetical protein [uncultured Brevundimonas sp.]
MDCYYCIVGTAEDPVAELCVLDARDDGAALAGALRVAEDVAGWERVDIYAGERAVGRVERAAATPKLPLAA